MGPLIRANLKHHARRYTATVVAAAIAVAFVAAALVFGGALESAHVVAPVAEPGHGEGEPAAEGLGHGDEGGL